MSSEAELLAAWRGGDRAAGEELFDRHAESIFLFFRSKVGEQPAEDLAQETFIACLEAKHGISGEGTFWAYLFRAARNRLYNYLGRDKKKAAALDPNVTSLADLGISPSAALGHEQNRRLLLYALRRLPLELQIAVELFFFEKMRGPELAGALDIPEGTVRSRLRRAREAMVHDVESLKAQGQHLKTTASDLQGWADAVKELAGED